MREHAINIVAISGAYRSKSDIVGRTMKKKNISCPRSVRQALSKVQNNDTTNFLLLLPSLNPHFEN